MAQTFSRYVPFTAKLFDTEVKLKLYAFDRIEGPAFRDRVQATFERAGQQENETAEEAEKRNEALLADFLALTKETFCAEDSKGRGKYVRLVESLRDEEDESASEITTGAELFEISPGDFHQAVMVKLASLASLSDVEGKSSGSLSTSTVAAGQSTDSPGSPAPSTAAAATTGHSTVTATPAPVPFSRAV